jgi:iron(II)-dependent oxidoreductase
MYAYGEQSTQSERGPHGRFDGDLVLVPGGTFMMGKNGEADFSPAHEVIIDSFLIERHEVTNLEYAGFCEETGHRLPEFWGLQKYRCGPEFPDHPVVGVSWADAKAYAEWRGLRLPTEAEWEYAARGGLIGKDYSFGSEIDSTKANYAVGGVGTGTLPVGSFAPNGFGLHDMTGNVVEWVSDFYDEDYYAVSPVSNPPGPESGKFRVIRGGGWHSGPFCNRVYFRNGLPSGWLDINVGFRCAGNLHPLSPGIQDSSSE